MQVPQISSLFTVYYRDMSGKELECCMAISPMMLFLPSSSQCVLVQQGAYYSTEVLLLVYLKLIWRDF